ncbi:hypothetical protein HIM_05705 [Hirsutella minnesotensis 3608]|uniref:Uncharacterized protein n=1 Tax=Hirsutella minnesotensis 3608 TaxID=1043627 RepID=A0A0F8A5A2_9HYPO|nr:hypothetical protein HIM_05705 [Hirsutella minnesotensis 3608]
MLALSILIALGISLKSMGPSSVVCQAVVFPGEDPGSRCCADSVMARGDNGQCEFVGQGGRGPGDFEEIAKRRAADGCCCPNPVMARGDNGKCEFVGQGGRGPGDFEKIAKRRANDGCTDGTAPSPSKSVNSTGRSTNKRPFLESLNNNPDSDINKFMELCGTAVLQKSAEACVGTQAWCEDRLFEMTEEKFDSPEACLASREATPSSAPAPSSPPSPTSSPGSRPRGGTIVFPEEKFSKKEPASPSPSQPTKKLPFFHPDDCRANTENCLGTAKYCASKPNVEACLAAREPNPNPQSAGRAAQPSTSPSASSAPKPTLDFSGDKDEED